MEGDVKMIPGTVGSLACLRVNPGMRRSRRKRKRRDEAATASKVAEDCV